MGWLDRLLLLMMRSWGRLVVMGGSLLGLVSRLRLLEEAGGEGLLGLGLCCRGLVMVLGSC